MTKTPETPTVPKKPDGIITTQIQNQTIVAELFFNHDSKETFGDKLLKILSDRTLEVEHTTPSVQNNMI